MSAVKQRATDTRWMKEVLRGPVEDTLVLLTELLPSRDGGPAIDGTSFRFIMSGPA